jgi:hypothetical protein
MNAYELKCLAAGYEQSMSGRWLRAEYVLLVAMSRVCLAGGYEQSMSCWWL